MQATSAVDRISPPSNYWQWQDYNIHYVRSGNVRDNQPPLLLIHGFGASTDHWRKNIAQLQENHEVWAIDLLGFGRSAKPNREYSGGLWRDQVTHFITEIIKKPVILAGNSLGGYVALCVAAECPEKAKGVILLNSAGPFSDTVTNEPNALQKLIRGVLLQPWASYLLFQYVRQKSNIRKTLLKVYLDPAAVTEELIEDIYRPSCDPGAVEVFAAVFKSPQGEKIDTLLQKLTHPLLLLWGEKDPWIDARSRGEKFRQYYPSLTEHYLQAGHCPHDEIPEQINALISGWMDENF
ncbi:MAG: 2-hydroxy-6-oxo-2,4-heptadienoate hydrolase [Chroococcopsis gigantea SAG 12.99]|jgi:pimeloyl-ACP methyl ester carboxylesterase|nr:alpha/beta fold hydrolase [Chlorogloea purpurea SAG 13.99]MDV2998911.1 2-hydroxy-6-oxo-2,4-heptadienoate hydrolase [Chroococcopsis gigantea SAG 12.99]